MTVFYLLMEYARRKRYGITAEKPLLAAAWALSIIRVMLCCFPQNGWTSAAPSLLWGILRNIPFLALGVLTVILWYRCAKQDKPLKLAWLAVSLSFLFYIPVVLFSHTAPIIGMLMLPKTCMYVWLILMFKETLIKSSAKIAPSDFEANWTKKPQGAGLRGRPLAAGEKHRPRRQPRLY